MRTQDDTFTTVHSFFTWDHRRLEGQLAGVLAHLDASDLPAAERLLGHYARGMKRHTRIEEQVIFELYAFERTGVARSPGPQMQAEHTQILQMIRQMQDALAAGNVDGFREIHARLTAFLPAHTAREEEALYPYLDGLLGADEAAQTVARLRAE